MMGIAHYRFEFIPKQALNTRLYRVQWTHGHLAYPFWSHS